MRSDKQQHSNPGPPIVTQIELCKRTGGSGTSPPRKVRIMKLNSEETIINNRILTDARFVCEAVLLLDDRQTERERKVRQTLEKNRRGFDVVDAPVFTNMAERIRATGCISASDLQICRKIGRKGIPRLGKYRKQLLEAPSIWNLPCTQKEAA